MGVSAGMWDKLRELLLIGRSQYMKNVKRKCYYPISAAVRWLFWFQFLSWLQPTSVIFNTIVEFLGKPIFKFLHIISLIFSTRFYLWFRKQQNVTWSWVFKCLWRNLVNGSFNWIINVRNAFLIHNSTWSGHQIDVMFTFDSRAINIEGIPQVRYIPSQIVGTRFLRQWFGTKAFME